MNNFANVNPIYRIEADKLAKGLIEKGIAFEYHKCCDGIQIYCSNGWDAICHSDSYGHERGLLEIMGTIVRVDDDVEGWLTAEEILQRLNLTV